MNLTPEQGESKLSDNSIMSLRIVLWGIESSYEGIWIYSKGNGDHGIFWSQGYHNDICILESSFLKLKVGKGTMKRDWRHGLS
jgi:hypothetical protein